MERSGHRQPEQGPGLARHPDHRRAPLRQVRHHAELRELLQGPGTDSWIHELSENWPDIPGQQSAKGTSGVVTAVKQADGTIGYADFSQVGDLGTAAIKVGENYNEISADAGSKVIEDSEIDTSVKGDNRVVVKINHATEAKGAYPIVLVSYDIACPAYKDASTAKFVKSWLTYVTSDEGQKTASSAAGSAPLPSNIVEKVTKSIEAIKTK